VIANCEGPELLRAFYEAIRSISVLDPTCGSGAFLFAALNLLERLYDTRHKLTAVADIGTSPFNHVLYLRHLSDI
jgi:hypothetical protein